MPRAVARADAGRPRAPALTGMLRGPVQADRGAQVRPRRDGRRAEATRATRTVPNGPRSSFVGPP